jgi:hypothetical protein
VDVLKKVIEQHKHKEWHVYTYIHIYTNIYIYINDALIESLNCLMLLYTMHVVVVS